MGRTTQLYMFLITDNPVRDSTATAEVTRWEGTVPGVPEGGQGAGDAA